MPSVNKKTEYKYDHESFAYYLEPPIVRTWYKYILVIPALLILVGSAGLIYVTLTEYTGAFNIWYEVALTVGLVSGFGCMFLMPSTGKVRSSLFILDEDKLSTEQFARKVGWKKCVANIDHSCTRYIAIGYGKVIDFAYVGTYNRRRTVLQQVSFFRNTVDAFEPKSRCSETCIQIDLGDITFPFMEIHRKNSFKEFNKSLGWRQYGKKLHLEGAFNENYEVLILPKTETYALTFLTPDFMDELLNCLYDFSFEMSGNYLYVYSSDMEVGTGAPVIHNLLGGADVVLNHIAELRDTWNKASWDSEINETLVQVAELRAERTYKDEIAFKDGW